MDYEEFKRVVVSPYWCQGSPLRWTDGRAGLAYFAHEGKVGVFNLAWWAMGQPPHPVPQSVYVGNLGIRWAVVYAPLVKCEGKPLTDHASTLKLQDFNSMMRRALQAQKNLGQYDHRIANAGMSEGLLWALATKKSVGA